MLICLPRCLKISQENWEIGKDIVFSIFLVEGPIMKSLIKNIQKGFDDQSVLSAIIRDRKLTLTVQQISHEASDIMACMIGE